MLADMAMTVEAARLLTYGAAARSQRVLDGAAGAAESELTFCDMITHRIPFADARGGTRRSVRDRVRGGRQLRQQRPVRYPRRAGLWAGPRRRSALAWPRCPRSCPS